jgi:hypothetical protein
MATTDISSEEYKKFLDERERITKAMEAAESEFMFQTYKKLLAVLNKRYEAAIRLNIVMENRAVREMAQEKRKQFDTAKVS